MLKLNTPSGNLAIIKRVFDIFHLGNQISQTKQFLRRPPACQNEFNVFVSFFN
jgi:hypothetical protein